MGILDKLRQIFSYKERLIDSNQSQINQSLEHPPSEQTIPIEPGSLQLGIAAGYTGRSIRDIESSLNRIESQMATKDWVDIKLREAISDKLDKIISYLETISHSGILQEGGFRDTVGRVVASEGLTPKMKSLLDVVEDADEISYSDLAIKLNISENSLRGLLSIISRRTNDIQRFEKSGRGWVRRTDSITNQSVAEPIGTEFIDERDLRDAFKKIILNQGHQVVKEFESGSPDLLISKDGILTAVELKRKLDFSKAFGQLLYAKSKYTPQNIWLVLSEIPTKSDSYWLELMEKEQIKVFVVRANELITLEKSMLGESARTYDQIDKEIEGLLKEFPNGLTKSEVSMKLGLDLETVDNHVKYAVKGVVTSSLKGRIRVENDRIIIVN